MRDWLSLLAQELTSRPIRVFLLFWALAQFFYVETLEAGFVTDFTGLQQRLEGAAFLDFLHCFGFPALAQVSNLGLWLLHSLGAQGLHWHLVFTTLHALNALLLFSLGRMLFWRSGVRRASTFALLAALLFLLSPYQTEPVVWRVCLNFLLSSFFMLAALNALVRWLDGAGSRWLWVFHAAFFLGLFTFELALSLPLMALLLVFFWHRAVRPLAALPHLLTWSMGPPFLLLGVYFALNRLLFGDWVGHYGAEVHLSFPPLAVGGNVFKYLSKFLLFSRDWPHPYKAALNGFWENPYAVGGFALLTLAALWVWACKTPTLDPRLRTAGLWFVLFLLTLLPAVNLYHGWILHIENDRYGYLALGFFWLFFFAPVAFLPRRVSIVLGGALLLLSVWLLQQNTARWSRSAEVYYSLLDDFRWEGAPQIFVLAFPDNYQGAPLFKDFSRRNRALKDALHYQGGKKPRGEFVQVLQFNMTRPEDGCSVRILEDGDLKITFRQWGNWWWRHGIGATSYEAPTHTVRIEGNAYRFHLREALPEAVFIYSDDGGWKEVPPPTLLSER